jgi:aspartyl-tRNA synthetase
MSLNNLIINFKNLSNQSGIVTVGGFVHSIRDHGGLIFIDLRSDDELIQCVINPDKNPNVFKIAETIRNEFVIKVTGSIIARSEGLINPNIATGGIEIEINELEIVAEAKTLPFDIHNTNQLAGEEVRLKYRYLDFRRSKLRSYMNLRSKFILNLRNWFDSEDFIEVQTPILANPSPEGSRDYVVPSRLQPGKFYALPQAPQQFKQLLMVGGFTKYFQIAPCFRDEDPRADRAVGDFYQLDLEMAWAQPEDIYKMFEKCIQEAIVIPKFTDKKLADTDFLKITYQDAMNKYGSDKPDLRYKLEWADAKPIFRDSEFKVFADLCNQTNFKNSKVQALVIRGGVEKFTRSDLDKIQDIGRQNGLPGIAYIQYTSEGAKSPIFKFFGTDEQIELKKQEIETHFNIQTGDLVLFIANSNKNLVYKAQNQMRVHIAKHLNLIDDSILKFAWIYDFPFFEEDEATGKIDFTHNPFGIWKSEEGLSPLETLKKVEASGDLLSLKAVQYDIICNGYEISSGGARNTNPDALIYAFELVGYTEEEVKNRFGHMLEAYSYGAPNHAGFAPGIDRILMLLTGENNIREIIPFPKNGSGIDLMTNSPLTIEPKALKDLNLKILD